MKEVKELPLQEVKNKLPNDLLELIADYKSKEYQEIYEMLEESVMNSWFKFCNCVDCVAKRARFKHFVEDYYETF